MPIRAHLFVACSLLLAAAGCGEEAPTQVNISIQADGELPGEPTRIVVFVKQEATGDQPRVILGGDRDFAYTGDLSRDTLSLGLRPGEQFDGEVYFYVQVRNETGILGTGGGRVDVSATTDLSLRIAPYSRECDVDADGFIGCFDVDGVSTGCCEHFGSAAVEGLTDCEDVPEELVSKYSTFHTENPFLSCDDDPVARDIHPFVETGSEATGCLCGNGIDEDCAGGDMACPETDADNDGYTVLRDCNDGDADIHPGAPEFGDAVDSDCDGEVDEVTCGIDRDDDGQCAPQDCDDSDDNIYEGAPESPNNGIDEDCDGRDSVIQEPDDRDRDGFVDAQAGGDDCNDLDAGIFPGGAEVCGSGVDGNCDGVASECAEGDSDGDGAAGADDCDDGDPTIGPNAPEICGDQIDQNCDGSDVSCDDDQDGDQFVGADDCDDDDPAIKPGAIEYCDGVDNNCDGVIDEGNPLQRSGDEPAQAERCGTIEEGACEFGFTTCSESAGNSLFLCAYAITPVDETCDGVDNNCDGTIDEGNPDGGGECTVSGELGVCAEGVEVCIEGGDGALQCEGPEPAVEVCDSDDNDCDGFTDESDDNDDEPLSVACYTGPEGTEGLGICHGSVRVCADGVLPDTCEGEQRPLDETCANPGSDDDCDDVEDNIPLEGVDCFTGEPGVCAPGAWACVDVEGVSTLLCESDISASDETCANMGADDNCDGEVDNIVDLGGSCSVTEWPSRFTGCRFDASAPAYCKVGEQRCVSESLTCVPTLTDFVCGAETCANEGGDTPDNDCNGIDDDVALPAVECDSGESGLCGPGQFECGGGVVVCVPDVDPEVAILAGEGTTCDGDDNDCNGLVDDIAGVGDSCDSGLDGVCSAGRMRCTADDVTNGQVPSCVAFQTPTGGAGTTDETQCNGIDDDCDGDIDEGFASGPNEALVYNQDPAHCGACGLDCTGDGQECCDGLTCANTDIDELNCGQCGNPCATNEVCVDGTCECADGDVCSDDEACSDELGTCRCGAGPACEDSETCDSGDCLCGADVCGNNEVCDGGTCECGEGPACEANEACVTGGSGLECQCVNDDGCAGALACVGGTCYDLQTSTDACGVDRVACRANETCVTGQCQCNGDVCTAFESCDGSACECGDRSACLEIEECGPLGQCRCGDRTSCEEENAVFGAEGVCAESGEFAGQCTCGGEAECGAGEFCCDDDGSDACFDLQTDADHCGVCGNACGAGESCVAGECKCQYLGDTVTAAACTGSDVCCESVGCNDLEDPALCGDCALANDHDPLGETTGAGDVICNSGEACAAGVSGLECQCATNSDEACAAGEICCAEVEALGGCFPLDEPELCGDCDLANAYVKAGDPAVLGTTDGHQTCVAGETCTGVGGVCSCAAIGGGACADDTFCCEGFGACRTLGEVDTCGDCTIAGGSYNPGAALASPVVCRAGETCDGDGLTALCDCPTDASQSCTGVDEVCCQTLGCDTLEDEAACGECELANSGGGADNVCTDTPVNEACNSSSGECVFVNCASGFVECGSGGTPCIAPTVTNCGTGCVNCNDTLEQNEEAVCDGVSGCGTPTCAAGFQDCQPGSGANAGCEVAIDDDQFCGDCSTNCEDTDQTCSTIATDTYACRCGGAALGQDEICCGGSPMNTTTHDCCDGTPILLSDINNCGGCDIQCDAGRDFQCQDPGSGFTCICGSTRQASVGATIECCDITGTDETYDPDDAACCAGGPELFTDENNCGGCGTTCDVGSGITCTGTGPSADCLCGGVAYTGDDDACCNGSPYDSDTQDCCGGTTIVERSSDASCGGCGTTCNTTDGFGCALNGPSYECMCGSSTDPLDGSDCCTTEGTLFNPATEVCCGTTEVCDTAECCGSVCVTLESDPHCGACDVDCSSVTATCDTDPSNRCECDGNLIDPATERCCGTTIVTGLQTDEFCGSCTNDCDARGATCDGAGGCLCGGELLAAGELCCEHETTPADKAYDPDTELCCATLGVVANDDDHCGDCSTTCTDGFACGAHLTSFACLCGTTVDPEDTTECCATEGEVFNPATEVCCGTTEVCDTAECCSGTCEDLEVDGNCGMCGVDCASMSADCEDPGAGFVCRCADDQTLDPLTQQCCGGVRIALQNDLNCGACGTSCTARGGATCNASLECVCSNGDPVGPGESCCGGAKLPAGNTCCDNVAHPNTDGDCGCGDPSPNCTTAGETCDTDAGVCVCGVNPTCDGGTPDCCGGSCVDFTDVATCGGCATENDCDTLVNTGDADISGVTETAVCDTGNVCAISCAGDSTVLEDIRNASEATCAGTQASPTVSFSCDSDYMDCVEFSTTADTDDEGCEADLTDEANCGDCNLACDTETVTDLATFSCSGGACACANDDDCWTDVSAPAGLCCGLLCVIEDESNCGVCGEVCDSGDTCEDDGEGGFECVSP